RRRPEGPDGGIRSDSITSQHALTARIIGGGAIACDERAAPAAGALFRPRPVFSASQIDLPTAQPLTDGPASENVTVPLKVMKSVRALPNARPVLLIPWRISKPSCAPCSMALRAAVESLPGPSKIHCHDQTSLSSRSLPILSRRSPY
ncbi:MAG: hypothetical protein ACLPGW_06875, partial [Roseiarcus sp.]